MKKSTFINVIICLVFLGVGVVGAIYLNKYMNNVLQNQTPDYLHRVTSINIPLLGVVSLSLVGLIVFGYLIAYVLDRKGKDVW